ncbi:unnamed protein product [Sphenostylis stenocarpa]|uniref:Uncharacterized protein n=1 Tax=Sphenostylis stenocarpa TaxID=92480 RepID=A0AA86VF01_9FABA|nr:unnamed protein product [Sphenostylis stenocarpa]
MLLHNRLLVFDQDFPLLFSSMDEVEWGHFPCHNPIRYPYFETTLGNLMLHKSTKTHVIRSLLGHIEDEAQRLVGLANWN